MSETERLDFAKKVMKQFLGPEIEPSHEADGPDFMATRHRCMWIKTDEDYTVAERFKTEDITPGLEHYYQTGHLPVMVYVSLYDEQGNPCRWLKGGSYTVQLHYGSMLPGQRMQRDCRNRRPAGISLQRKLLILPTKTRRASAEPCRRNG